MKYYPIQLMDNEFCLLSATKAKHILNQKNFKSVKLSEESHSILVRIKDLTEIKNTIGFYVLDDTGTELYSSDIQAIMENEHICCE